MTASSSKSGHALQPLSSYGNREPGPTSAPAALHNQQRRSPLNTADQDPFAFHKLSPVSARTPTPLNSSYSYSSRPSPAYSYGGDGLPSVPLPQQSPTHPTRPYGHGLGHSGSHAHTQGLGHGSIPHPQPMRHAATVDGQLSQSRRRRSNSLEGSRAHARSQRDSSSPPRATGNRTRTHTTSELPPSLASLVLAGPVEAPKHAQSLPRFAPDRGVPTLPPMGWTAPTPDRPDNYSQIHHYHHNHNQNHDHSQYHNRVAQLPGVRDMFGTADSGVQRR